MTLGNTEFMAAVCTLSVWQLKDGILQKQRRLCLTVVHALVHLLNLESIDVEFRYNHAHSH